MGSRAKYPKFDRLTVNFHHTQSVADVTSTYLDKELLFPNKLYASNCLLCNSYKIFSLPTYPHCMALYFDIGVVILTLMLCYLK